MADSYRPQRQPPLADRISFTNGGGSSYRPGPPGAPPGPRSDKNRRNPSEFTFTSGRPGPQFPPAGPEASNQSQARRRNNRGGRSRRGGNHQGSDHNLRSHDSQAHGGRRDPGNRGRSGFRSFHKPAPHERALLQNHDAGSPERTLGVIAGSNRFLDLDDLSASDEEMDIEDDKASDESAQEGRHKAVRTRANNRADGDSVPKWSNPDPYTVLPPPSDTTGKKRDFVQLIRKAKNQAAENPTAGNAVAANNDFISFGADEEDEDEELVKYDLPPPPPTGPPPIMAQPPPPPTVPLPNYPLVGSLNDVVANGALPDPSRGAKRSAEGAGLPQRPQHPDGQSSKRKRGQLEGGLVSDWLPSPYVSSAPWCKNQTYGYLNTHPKHKNKPVYEKMLMLLNNEIADFYDLVEPSGHEKQVRRGLISRIEKAISKSILPGVGKVLCFGSFPVGLYLPTADMDLVLATVQHINGGPKSLNFDSLKQKKRVLSATANKLKSHGIAKDTNCIWRAKVPIVKFTDQRTGIKVDISFENLTGLAAQRTFERWKQQMPDLHIIVALIKQFLVMRGLSDVHTGGLGGFSIICLVYYHLHDYYRRNAVKRPNIGTIFMDFLDFYGNRFDLAGKRLVMDPPSIVNKQQTGIDGRQEKPDGLSIQDPNDPSNNISGGSSRAKQIFQAFSQAHKALDERMQTADFSESSILEAIIGGNYESYRLHREHISRLA